MKLQEANKLALELMEQHGLIDDGWTLQNSKGTRVYGSCSHWLKLIKLSKPFAEINDRKAVKGVILHEIAHALVEPRQGHNQVWKTKAKELGIKNPTPYTIDAIAPKYTGKQYLGRCPNGHTYMRKRLSRKGSSCGKCSNRYNPEYLLKWEEVKGD